MTFNEVRDMVRNYVKPTLVKTGILDDFTFFKISRTIYTQVQRQSYNLIHRPNELQIRRRTE